MKPNNNKEQQKIILVGALFVAMLAVLGYNLFGAQAPAAPAVAPSPGAPGGAASTTPGGAPAPGASPAAPAGPIFDPLRIPLVTSGRDPFVPAGAATQAPTPTPPPANPAPYLNTHGLPPKGELAKGLNSGGNSLSDFLNQGRSATPAPQQKVEPVPLPPPAPPAYVVTGVVLGDKGGRDVAILRGSGSVGEDRKFVTVGEDVGNGFYVAAIRADGILLKSRLNATQSPVNISLGKSE